MLDCAACKEKRNFILYYFTHFYVILYDFISCPAFVKFFSGFLDRLLKEWLLVALDRWSSYTITIVWEFAWVDSALVALAKWSSYRGGRLNRFDCNALS